MKKIVLLFFVCICFSGFAQNVSEGSIKSFKIKQKVCLKKPGNQLVLKEVVSDSRCPEGASCIWAGEVKAVIAVYKEAKLLEEKTLVLSEKLSEVDTQWLSNYLPEKKKNIKKMTVLPYPKQGRTINPKKYFLKVEYLE